MPTTTTTTGRLSSRAAKAEEFLRGKYRVAVTQKMLREAFDAAKPKAKPGQKKITRETDFLGDRFGVSSSPIFREIKGKTEVVIDLDDPTKS